MKKILFIILGTLLFVSCDTSYPVDLTKKQVFNFEVKAKDWVKYSESNGLNPYYKCHFNINAGSGYSLDDCAVLAYINFGDYEQSLPWTRHFENTSNIWTRTVDFDYSLRDINFYVTNSDFANDPPETMYFRVVFIW
ncbi:MAG: hypothetical protein LBN23_01110 [Paludibacter sp.]|jgi:hypothetical protein|nr:hypothetical protein [Paludibacter sp.]